MRAGRTDCDVHERRVRHLAAAGGVLGMIGVAAGAVGAHALKSLLSPEQLAVFDTAVRYQVIHALGLFACAWALQTWPSRVAFAAGGLFFFGTILFCGSLYALALSGQSRFGLVTPIGGAAFFAGWLLLIAAVTKRNKSGDPVG
jgi:uncharacterized membrane protein YgdD (TMEM256/DUF423 family)